MTQLIIILSSRVNNTTEQRSLYTGTNLARKMKNILNKGARPAQPHKYRRHDPPGQDRRHHVRLGVGEIDARGSTFGHATTNRHPVSGDVRKRA